MEMFKGKRRQEIGLINIEQRVALFGADELIKGGTDAGHYLGFGKGGFLADGKEDLSVEVAYTQGAKDKSPGCVDIGVKTKERTAVDLPEPISPVTRPMPCSLTR
jgi:hypothetical protein